MKTKSLMLLVLALLTTAVVFGGCKKKEQPASAKAPTMEDMHKNAEEIKETAAKAGEEVKKAAEEAAAQVEQTTCPVMDGNPIDKNVFVMYKGKKVYFCCSSCKAKFEADPEKYISKLPQFKQ